VKCDYCLNETDHVIGVAIISGTLNLDKPSQSQYRQQGFSCSACLPKLRITFDDSSKFECPEDEIPIIGDMKVYPAGSCLDLKRGE